MNNELVQEQEISEGANGSAEDVPIVGQDALFEHAVANYSQALARLALGYEADSQRRQDLLQDIHLKLWQSFASFDHRCSLRTWVYRIAHNVAVTYVTREKRIRRDALVGLEELDSIPDTNDEERNADTQRVIERLNILIRKLKPLDRQVVLLQLDGLTPADIAAVTGISPGNVSIKLHRFTEHLKKQFTTEKQP